MNNENQPWDNLGVEAFQTEDQCGKNGVDEIKRRWVHWIEWVLEMVVQGEFRDRTRYP